MQRERSEPAPGPSPAAAEAAVEDLRAAWTTIERWDREFSGLQSSLVQLLDSSVGRRNEDAYAALCRDIAVLRNKMAQGFVRAEAVLARLRQVQPGSMEARHWRAAEDLRARIGAARHRYLLWARIGHALTDAFGFRRLALVASDEPNRLGGLDQLIRALSDAVGAFHRVANPHSQDENAETEGAFADIPMRAVRFAALELAAWRLAQAIEPRDSLSFLDVGCGGGLRVVQASLHYQRADGLDYDPGYVRSARRVLQRAAPGRATAFRGDGRTFVGYGRYDVIYFYRPMRDPVGLRALEDRILSTARPGTILIAPYSQFEVRPPATPITDCLYVVGLPARKAGALLKKAERMGNRVRHAGDPSSAESVFYPDLVRALNRSGFAIV